MTNKYLLKSKEMRMEKVSYEQSKEGFLEEVTFKQELDIWGRWFYLFQQSLLWLVDGKWHSGWFYRY